MPKILFFLFLLSSGFLTAPLARADGCSYDGGNVMLTVPKMVIPADTPNGTILYTSPRMTKTLTCQTSKSTQVMLVTTADYQQFVRQMNGVSFNLYINGTKLTDINTIRLGQTNSSQKVFKANVQIWFQAVVDSSKGKIPLSGTLSSAGFESVYSIINSDYNLPRGIISVSTPPITYLPCSMAISVTPDTINFAEIRSRDLDKGQKIQKKFSTLITKSKGCTIINNTNFGIDMFFEPTSSTITPDGSLNLNNGISLSIYDSKGKFVPYNTALKIDNVKLDSVLKNDFTATLQKIAGQDIQTGHFSGDIVIRINYY